MSAKTASIALTLVLALGLAVLAGEPPPEAPPPETPVAEPGPESYDFFDQLKHIEAAGIVFKFGGEARFRYQYWDDYDIDEYRPLDGRGGRSDGFFDTRLLLNVEAQLNEQISVFVEGIDARRQGYADGRFGAFGVATRPVVYHPGHNHFDLHQAWVLIQSPAGLPVVFKLGRQRVELNSNPLGSGRILGNQMWRNSPQVFDAALMIIPADPVTIAAWAGKAVLFPDRDSYDHVLSRFDYYGVYTMWQVPGLDACDLYWMYLRQDQDLLVPGDLEIHAIGIRLEGTIAENLKWGIEHVQEFGDVGPFTLQAWALHTELGYTLAGLPWTPTVAVEYNHATGDSGGLTGDSQLNTFFTWFPNYHGMFGIMDMFQWSNMEHYKVGCKLSPAERVSLEVAGHVFYLNETGDRWFMGRSHVPAPLGGSGAVGRGPGGSDRVGEEIDIVVTVDVNEHCTVEAGYAHFFDESYISDTGLSGGADFGYVMTTLRF